MSGMASTYLSHHQKIMQNAEEKAPDHVLPSPAFADEPSNKQNTAPAPEDTYGPIRHRCGRPNDARIYTTGAARTVQVFDGKEHVLAVLLSAQLAEQITEGICVSRSLNQTKSEFDAKLARVEDQRIDSVAKFQIAEFQIKLMNSRL